MSDPLSLIRQVAMNNGEFEHADGHYLLGGYNLPEDTPTAFKKSLKVDQYYTIRDVIFCFQNRKLPLSEYRRNSVHAKVAAVIEMDRPALLEFLLGEKATCPQIDQHAVDSYVPPAQASERAKPSASSSKHHKSDKHADKTSKSKSATEAAATDDGRANRKEKEHKRKAETAFPVPAMESSAAIDKTLIEADKPILAKIRSNFFPVVNKNGVYNVVGSDFSVVLKLFNDKILKPKDSKVDSSTPSASTAIAPNASETNTRQPGRSAIIIVPTSLTTCINLYNIKDFLLEGKFISIQDKLNNSIQKPKLEVFSYHLLGKQIPFKIIDDATKLEESDWNRVVAVFVSGQEWQFNGWKYKTPVELFQHVLGVHIMFDDRPPDVKVQSWNCKLLKISQHKQHVNAGTSREFWQLLQEYIRLHKSHVLPDK